MSNKRIFAKDLGVELVLDEEVDADLVGEPTAARNNKRTKYHHHTPCDWDAHEIIDYGNDDEDDEEDEDNDGEVGNQNQVNSKKNKHDCEDGEENGVANVNKDDALHDKDDETEAYGDQEQGDCNEDEDEDEIRETSKKCVHWPNCLQGDKCAFYHPVKPCKNFPRCVYGNDCLYVHPPCKFNPNCSNPSCIFSHTKNTDVKWPGKRYQKPLVPRCKFGHHCMNVNCRFSHQRPEPCRFGANCLLETCQFTHPTDINRKKPDNAFKWTAQS